MVYVVGYSRTRPDRGPIDLGAQLARTTGESLHVVTVVPHTWPTPVAGHTDREFEQFAAEQGERSAQEALDLLADGNDDVDATASWVPARSVPAGLLAHAATVGAAGIVAGSGSAGHYGYVGLSSSADRLVHSSQVPVALAPRGYRNRGGRVTRISVGFRGDEASRRALTEAARVAERVQVPLRVVTFGVRGRRMYPPEVGQAERQIVQAWLEQVSSRQEALLESLQAAGQLPDGCLSVTGVGNTWEEAMDDIEWRRDEILVLGSSASSPLARVFLGSNAAKIIRQSPVSVVLLPHD